MIDGEFLKLRETKFGVFLFINGKPQKIVIENRKITNNLTTNQLNFVKNYIKL